MEAIELGLRTQHLLFFPSPDWPSCFDGITTLSAINILPYSYRAGMCDVHSFALLSQVASYLNSSWSLLFETGGKLISTLWSSFFSFHSNPFLTDSSVDLPSVSFKDICSSIYRLLAQALLETDDKFVEFSNTGLLKTSHLYTNKYFCLVFIDLESGEEN